MRPSFLWWVLVEFGRSGRANGRESRVCLFFVTVRADLGPHPGNAKRPTCGCAQVGRSLGEVSRRRGGSNQDSELAASDQRPRVHSAQRSGVARGERRSLESEAVGTDGQESHGGHTRDARPRSGQSGQEAVGRARHGRAAGPRSHAPKRQRRSHASFTGLLERVAQGCDHGCVSWLTASKQKVAPPMLRRVDRTRRPTDHALRDRCRLASGRDSLH